MISTYEFFIAFRYLKSKRKNAFISLITFISIAGVTVGVMALIIVLAVMSGFEEDLKSKILGTNSHVVVLSMEKSGMENYTEVVEKVKQHRNVVSATPFIFSPVMLDRKSVV